MLALLIRVLENGWCLDDFVDDEVETVVAVVVVFVVDFAILAVFISVWVVAMILMRLGVDDRGMTFLGVEATSTLKVIIPCCCRCC